jgi:tRNA (cmo5U34)-methyltransferase
VSGETKAAAPFSGEHARSYDRKNAELAAFKDGLLLLAEIACKGAPADARVLCVGAGTGEEVVYLARRHPRWRFALVEPSHDMLEIGRQKMKELGLAERCVFHEGYLSTLPETEQFDAATCLLVAHFVLDRTDRIALYRQIALKVAATGPGPGRVRSAG